MNNQIAKSPKDVVSILIYLWLLTTAHVTSASSDIMNKHFQDQIDGYEKAIRQEKLKQVAQYFADDIRLMPEANPTILGKTHATHFFDQLFSTFQILDYKRTLVDTLDISNHKVVLGNYFLAIRNAEGKRYNIHGKYLNLWRNEKNAFELITDVWNFDQWFDHDGQLSFKKVPSTITALEAHLPVDTPLRFDLAAYHALSDLTIPLRDAPVIAQFYAQDALVLANFKPLIKGSEAINTYWKAHIKELAGFEKLQSRTDKILDFDDYVIEYASHIANWRNGINSGVNTGKHFRIWKRMPHGGLRVYVLISAYDK